MSEATQPAVGDAWVNEALPSQNFSQTRKLKVDDTASARKRPFLHFALPFNPREGISVVQGLLSLHLSEAAAGTVTWTIRRANAKWISRDVDWDTRPGRKATAATVVTVDALAGDELLFDVAPLLSEVSSGEEPWYGFGLNSDFAGVLSVHARKTLSTDPDLSPSLYVEWTGKPDAPDELSPSGGRIISAARPSLGWLFHGAKGETAQARARVEIAADDLFSSSLWDSGWFDLSESEIDLARNLLPKKNLSDAETDATGVGVINGSTVTRDAAGNAFLGSGAFKTVTPGSVSGEGIQIGNASAERFAVAPGEAYTLQGMLKGTGTVKVRIRWYQSDGTTLISEQDTDLTSYAIPAAYSVPFRADTPAAPALAAKASFIIVTTSSQARTWYADSLMASELASDDDAGEVPEWQPAFPALSSGDLRYWRVTAEDEHGRQSDPSEIASFQRRAQSSLSLDSPLDDATVEDLTPQILWTFGGTQVAVAHFLDRREDGEWKEILRVPRRKRSSAAWTVPAGYIRKTSDQYRIRLRVWDAYDRESRPGDPAFVEASARFAFVRSATPLPVTSLVASERSDPGVDLAFHRASAPDFFCLVVDGDRVQGRLEPADLSEGGGDYLFTYYGALPNYQHSYEIEAVVNIGGALKHSQGNATDQLVAIPSGIWLIDEEDPTSEPIVLRGPEDDIDFVWGETAGTFFPVGEDQPPVRRRQQSRGREGTVSGSVRQQEGATARQYLGRLRRLWKSGRIVRLIAGNVNSPVVIGQPSERVVKSRGDLPIHILSFPVWQMEDFDRF